MSTPDDDVVERGRAIFEQLRQDGTPDAPLPDTPAFGPNGAPGQETAARDAGHEREGGPVAPGVEAHEPGRDTTPDPPVAPGPGPERAAASDHSRVAAGTVTLESARPDPGTAASPADTVAEAGPVPGPAADARTGPGPDDGSTARDAPAGASGEPTAATVPDRPPPGPVPLGMPPEATSLLDPDTVPVDPSRHSPTRFARDLPRVMAIANQKGGVGKTTTAVNLGAGLAELGFRVLVVDLDPQGNATTGLGINPRNLESSIYDVLMHDALLDDCIEPTSLRNLFVCPATIDLAGAEIELVPAFSRELKLRRALEPVLEDFDFVVIDCPPSLGLITVNALAAATEVVVPIQCEYYALEGLGQLLRNVNLVQTNLNPRLEVSAIILTMFDARTKLADQVATEVRNHFGAKVCRNIVPRTVRLSEAPSFGQPIVVFDPTSRGAIAYRELAKEVSGGTPQRVG